MLVVIFLVIILLTLYFMSGVHTVPTSKIFVVERLGEYHKHYTGGLIYVFPFIDKIAYKTNSQTNYINIESFEVLTKDNVEKEVNIDKLGYIINDVETYVYDHPDYALDLIPVIIQKSQDIFHNYNSSELIENSTNIEEALKSELNQVTNTWGTSTTQIHYTLNDVK